MMLVQCGKKSHNYVSFSILHFTLARHNPPPPKPNVILTTVMMLGLPRDNLDCYQDCSQHARPNISC